MGFDGDIMVNKYIYIYITNPLCARMLDTGIPQICVFIMGNDDKQWDFGKTSLSDTEIWLWQLPQL